MASAPIREEIGDSNPVDGRAVQTRVDYRSASQVGFVDAQAREINVVNPPTGHVEVVERTTRHFDVVKVGPRQVDVVELRSGKVGFANVYRMLFALDLHR